MVFDKRYLINGISKRVFDKGYLIKSISAVTNYNSSSCLMNDRIYQLMNESSVSRTAHPPFKKQQ